MSFKYIISIYNFYYVNVFNFYFMYSFLPYNLNYSFNFSIYLVISIIIFILRVFFFGGTVLAEEGDVSPSALSVKAYGLADYLAYQFYCDKYHPAIIQYGPHYVNYELVGTSINNIRLTHYNNLMCNNCTFYNGIRYDLSPLV